MPDNRIWYESKKVIKQESNFSNNLSDAGNRLLKEFMTVKTNKFFITNIREEELISTLITRPLIYNQIRLDVSGYMYTGKNDRFYTTITLVHNLSPEDEYGVSIEINRYPKPIKTNLFYGKRIRTLELAYKSALSSLRKAISREDENLSLLHKIT